jgi:hypothetical protein
MAEWKCPHGTTYTGSDDFISGARNAHGELEGALAALRAVGRSVNDIAQDILDRAPEVEYLIEEWFVVTDARLHELRTTVVSPRKEQD